MKHFLLSISLLLCALTAGATPNIKSGSEYILSVGSHNFEGYVGLGSYHNANPYIYYYTGDDTLDDAYWIITKDGSGYTFCNAATGQYLSFTTERNNTYYKYLTLTNSVSSDNERWTFEQVSDGIYAIRSVANTGYYFNYRTDGSNMVGTFSGNSRTLNEQFELFDTEGNQVFETGSSQGITPVTTGKTYYITSYNYGRALSNMGSTSISNSYVYIETLATGSTSGKQKWKAIAAGNGIQLYNETYGYALDANRSAMRPLQWTAETSNANQQWYFSEVTAGVYQIYIKYSYYNYYLAADGYNTSLTTDNTDTDTYWTLTETTAASGAAITGGLSDVVSELYFNGRPLVYDNSSSQYFFSLPESVRDGEDFNLTVTWSALAGNDLIADFDGTMISYGTEVTLSGLTCQNPYTFTFYDRGTGNAVATGTINFSFLPLVEMTYSGDPSSGYTEGRISVHDGSDLYQTTPAKMKYRGATARSKPKKPYAIKLIDDTGSKTNLRFFGLRNDNNWILDPAYIDKTVMRNRVSTDLWNDFSAKPYHHEWEPSERNGTRGHFVEVFINGSYNGLYCMTEKIDRKQLNLKKLEEATDTTEAVVRGSLYKSKSWGYEIFWGPGATNSSFTGSGSPRAFSNTSESWANFEVKEPDLGDGEPIKWDPLWNAINFTATSSDADFYANFDTYLDRPVVDDYYLFLELILASDNHGKNMYYYVYNQAAAKKFPQRMSICPWDLDGTWGGRWDGSYNYVGAQQDFVTFIRTYEHGNLYYWDRMADIADFDWETTLADRYCFLRRTYFQPEALKERFQTYYDLIHDSGADSREQNKWGSAHGNIATAVSYVQDWIDSRVAYLDDKYGYSESDAVISIGQTGYATYYNSRSYILPAGVEAAVITAANGDKLTIDWRFPEGSTVPGGTAVLLRGAQGDYAITTYPVSMTESPVENMLHGSDVRVKTTGNGKHYKLAADGTGSVGFFFADSSTRSGAPFWSEAHKCWLVVPNSASVRGYSLGEATSVSTATLTDANGHNAYDLSGRRIRPTGQRGVYIINGKKVMR